MTKSDQTTKVEKDIRKTSGLIFVSLWILAFVVLGFIQGCKAPNLSFQHKDVKEHRGEPTIFDSVNRRGRFDRDVFERLIEQGISPEETNEGGVTLLDFLFYIDREARTEQLSCPALDMSFIMYLAEKGVPVERALGGMFGGDLVNLMIKEPEKAQELLNTLFERDSISKNEWMVATYGLMARVGNREFEESVISEMHTMSVADMYRQARDNGYTHEGATNLFRRAGNKVEREMKDEVSVRVWGQKSECPNL